MPVALLAAGSLAPPFPGVTRLPFVDGVVIVLIAIVLGVGGIPYLCDRVRLRLAQVRQRRRFAAELGASLQMLRATLAGAAAGRADRFDFDHASPTAAAPPAATRVHDLYPFGVLAGRQIGWWRTSLPRYRAVYNAFDELVYLHTVFDAVAARLNRRLVDAVTSHNVDHQIDPLTDRLDMAFMTGRILGIGEERLLPEVGLSGEALVALQHRCAATLALPGVVELSGGYAESRTRLVAALAALQRTLPG